MDEFLIDYSLVWYPMKLLEYSVNRKKYRFLFDAYLAKKIGKDDVYVLLIRNPKNFQFSPKKPFEGLELNHIVTGEEILQSLLAFRRRIDKIEAELYGDLLSDQAKLAIGSGLLFVPPQKLREYDAKSLYYSSILMAKEILRKIGFKKGYETATLLGEKNVYYPLLLSASLDEVIEIGLTNEPSRSLTELLKIEDVRKIFVEILSR